MNFFRNIFNKSVTPSSALTRWEELGILKDELEIPYLHPFHHDYPAWKGNERWLKHLRTNWNTDIVFTQGLAAPCEEKGYELYLETTDPVEQFSSSWQMNIIYELGKIIPNVNDLTERLSKYKFLSIQINIDGAPGDWSLQHPNGNIGLFLGLPNERLANFTPPHFTPLNVKLLRPSEMQYIIENKAEGRLKIAGLLEQQGNMSISSLNRAKVV